MLSSQRIGRLRSVLQAERVSLMNQVDHLAAASRESELEQGDHMADDGTEAFEQATTVSLRRSKELALAQIEGALRRMDEGRYGHCHRCAAEIDFARLKAIPYAELCMACQKLLEL